MKTFVRMSSGLNIRQAGLTGDGQGAEAETSEMLKKAAGIVQGEDGELRFGEWNYPAGQHCATWCWCAAFHLQPPHRH
jgi:hypothetical protein